MIHPVACPSVAVVKEYAEPAGQRVQRRAQYEHNEEVNAP